MAVRLSLATAIAVALDIAKRGRIKFSDGECHVLEHLAGIVCRGRETFLFGNGVFRSVNEILSGTFNAHDGKKSDRNGEHLTAVADGSAAETAANAFGQIVDIDAARGTVGFAYIYDICLQNDGINDFKNSCRKIGAGAFRMIAATEILCTDLTAEDIDVAFAAVENDFLFHDSDAIRFLRSAETSADLHCQFDIHRDMDLIKTAVEGNAVHVNIGTKDLRAFRADGACSFDQFAYTFRKVNRYVFKTIFIPTAVENSVCVYIYRVAIAAAIGRGISGIGHNDDHSFHKKIRNL